VSAAVAYLDGSAAVKLMHRERDTPALVDALASIDTRVSSELLEVELRCVAHRAQLTIERADDVLAGIDLLPYSLTIRRRAGEPFTPPQRALDALHLATALDLQHDRMVFVTYDGRQAAGAEACGLTTLTPIDD
jgi:uncharacterized protein